MEIFKKVALSGLCLVCISQLAHAQIRDAGSKIRDEAVQGHEVRTYESHAQDQSQILYYYSQSQKPIPKVEAKELVTGIRKNLTASDMALAKIKAAHAKEPQVLKQIALIEKHHAKAHEVCGMAEEHCLKEHGDQVVIGNCCSEMWHELDAAQSETKKLLKMLKIETLEPPKKTEPKKDATKSEEKK